MNKVSFNQLNGSFEVGTSSNWVVVFQAVGGRSPDINNLNIIQGKYCPVIDVSYDSIKLDYETLNVGPGIPIHIPLIANDTPETVSLTLYDDHVSTIKTAIDKWIKSIGVLKARSVSIRTQKDISVIVTIYHLNKLGDYYHKDSFYALPPDNISFVGNQSYSADSFPLTLKIIGRH